MKEGYVYIISDGDNFKVGVSKNPEQRLKNMQTGNPKELFLEHQELKNSPYKVEKELHRKLQDYKITGEWFAGLTLRDIRVQLLLCNEYD